MRSKSKAGQLIEFILICAIIGAAVYIESNIVQRKNADYKYIPFFKQESDFNVLFFGTSHVINGIFPMELWNDYGIVSYNFGGHANQLATSYWVMENSLNYTSPDLVVIDCLYLESDSKVSDNADYMHLSFDAFPVSYTKIKGILDLCDDPELVDKNGCNYYERRLEYIWDFGKYHTRWEEIDKQDWLNRTATREKGAETRIDVAVPNDYTKVPLSQKLENETVGIRYLKKIIEDCQQRDIQVLLIYLPFPAEEKSQVAANTVQDIAEEYEINYINFLDMELVDFDTDCYDPASHLNSSGARKVTDYLGKYIQENYAIPDQRSNPDYGGWYADYAEYVECKIEYIDMQTNLNNLLMLLADKGFSTCIHIKKDSAIYKEETAIKLLKNMCLCEKPELLNDVVIGQEGYFLLVDNVEKKLSEVSEQELCGLKTSFGEINYHRAENGKWGLYIDGQNKDNLFAWEGDTEPDVQILVIDNQNGNIALQSNWNWQSSWERDVCE